MDILIFVLILSFLVIIHELGHFLCAKKAGVTVEEFGLGYPPTAITVTTDKAGTAYTVNWLPFGGFVRLFGEDGETSGNGAGSFVSKPVGIRLLIVLAGAAVNFVFGVLAFGVIYTKVGIPTPLGAVEVTDVTPGTPAEVAGLTAGDRIASVTVGSDRHQTPSAEAYIDLLGKSQGQTITVQLTDGRSLPVYVRAKSEIPEGQGATGIRVQDYEMKFYPWWQMPFRGMWVGLSAAANFGVMILSALGNMVSELVLHGVVPKEVAGPVGIAYMAQKEGVLQQGWLMRINFAAILSINLAVMNVLPLPALDGGRAVFLVYEAIFKRRVNAVFEQRVNMIGFMALIALIVLISIKDIGRVAMDPNVQGFFQKIWPF